MRDWWEVTVGNIGTVYSGPSEQTAREAYAEYVEQSESGRGRAAGEAVTLWSCGEPILEHPGGLAFAETALDDVR